MNTNLDSSFPINTDDVIRSLLCDAHAHTGSVSELHQRSQEHIPSLICAVNPQEAAILLETTALAQYRSVIIPTYGLHPWHTEAYQVTDIEPYLKLGAAIGEIGMDSVWCSVPLRIQEAAFRKQLSIAADLKKSVILHTKGQEKQIASIIGEYKNTYLVHWYSSMEHIDDYIALNCYFSIGPNVINSPAVRQTASLVPFDRILVETDGLGAVAWAYEPHKPPVTVASALLATLRETASIRQISFDVLAKQIQKNFNDFILS